MAPSRETRRAGERGLSIIEAIVIATITALFALILMPLLPRGASSSFAMAERGISVLDSMRAEREFRTLLRSVIAREGNGEPQQVIAGDRTRMTLSPALAAPAGCARAGAPAVLLIIEANALVCVSEGNRRVLLRWQEGVATFAYSSDGVSWFADWNTPGRAPYVRFELRRNRNVEDSWIERIGAGES